jgi:hypothetical protein
MLEVVDPRRRLARPDGEKRLIPKTLDAEKARGVFSSEVDTGVKKAPRNDSPRAPILTSVRAGALDQKSRTGMGLTTVALIPKFVLKGRKDG